MRPRLAPSLQLPPNRQGAALDRPAVSLSPLTSCPLTGRSRVLQVLPADRIVFDVCLRDGPRVCLQPFNTVPGCVPDFTQHPMMTSVSSVALVKHTGNIQNYEVIY